MKINDKENNAITIYPLEINTFFKYVSVFFLTFAINIFYLAQPARSRDGFKDLLNIRVTKYVLKIYKICVKYVL